MIRVQPAISDSEQVVVSSDLPDPEAAHNEVVAWARDNAFVLSPGIRRVSAFRRGYVVGEYVLAVGQFDTASAAARQKQN